MWCHIEVGKSFPANYQEVYKKMLDKTYIYIKHENIYYWVLFLKVGPCWVYNCEVTRHLVRAC